MVHKKKMEKVLNSSYKMCTSIYTWSYENRVGQAKPFV